LLISLLEIILLMQLKKRNYPLKLPVAIHYYLVWRQRRELNLFCRKLDLNQY
jgi:hypothetical protein